MPAKHLLPETQKNRKKTSKNLKGKRSSSSWTQEEGKRLHKILSKETFTVCFYRSQQNLGLVCTLIRYAWLHSIISASMRWQQSSTDKMLRQKGVTIFSKVLWVGLSLQNSTALSGATGSHNLVPLLCCHQQSCTEGEMEPCLLFPDRVSHQVHLGQLMVGLDI